VVNNGFTHAEGPMATSGLHKSLPKSDMLKLVHCRQWNEALHPFLAIKRKVFEKRWVFFFFSPVSILFLND